MNLPVYIETPARLHLGFLDLEGGLGRHFGSIGLTLGGIATRILVRRADSIKVIGKAPERARAYAEKFVARKGLTGGCEIEIIEQISEHSGLGSGTQLALATGTALTQLYGLQCDSAAIATLLNRGVRSGIGVGAFQQGGFLVDAGRTTRSSIPPVVSRLCFPSDWRILLVFDRSHQGVHGADENASFSTLPFFSAHTAAYLCRLVVMRILPAISEADIDAFSQGIYELQKYLGEYFTSTQGGRYTSAAVSEVMAHLEALHIRGVGQSSWGPTGFAFINSETQAHALLRELRAKFSDNRNLRFRVVTGRNTGAVIERQNAVSLAQASGY